MHMHKESGAQKKSIALLSAVLFTLTVAFPSVASAEYNAIQYMPVQPPNVQGRQVNNFDVPSVQAGFTFTATSTFYATSISVPVCTQNAGASFATLVIKDANALATTTIPSLVTLASTTPRSLFGAMACPNMGVTFQFAFSPPFQFVSGQTYAYMPVWTKGTSAPIPTLSGWGVVQNLDTDFRDYHAGGADCLIVNNWCLSADYSPFFSIQAGGTAPSTTPEVYTSSFDCSTFDLGCYVASSFAWAFVPQQSTFDQFADITLASSTPFNYLFEIGGYFDILRNGVATTTIISVDFVGNELILYNSVNMGAVIGAQNMARVTFVKTLIGYVLYLTLLFAVWREVIKMIRHDN